ncbi:MAG: FtsW/RodA/SpoVE family cell cycle protein [Chitinophagaceae bacterium]|nr:FtsW/RodA/SpoVE family cell cycle protein [Chitinophagaceae bacterium]
MKNPLGISLFLVTLVLSLIGIFILYESSSYTALLNIGDKYYFVKNQSMWLVLGITLCFILSKINYKIYKNLALPFLIITFALLIAVFLPGIGLSLKGAHRWINLGFTVIQPSELLKITLTLYLAAWFSVKEKGRLLAFLLLLGACVFLVIAEPDLGTTTIITATAILVYFFQGAKIKEIVVILILFFVAVFFLIKLEPYRAARFAEYMNFNTKDFSTTSYHVKQILIALGSGGVSGVGFGRSVQKYAYLPENTTDSIFAIYSEEAGFIGSFFLISLFFIQLVIGYGIAIRTSDVFGRILAFGIITFMGVQTILNLASQVVLFPLTGVPLPFISYGGSSMVINFMSIGIILSIAKSEAGTLIKRGKKI